jgi:3'(2'), 5'-bisphosphate nucleotidase
LRLLFNDKGEIMLDVNNPQVRFALDVVTQASQLVRQIQLEMASPSMSKEDRSPVTVADFASQALVAYLLSEYFPNDVLVAEEDSQALRDPNGSPTLTHVTGFVSRFLPHATTARVCDWIDRGVAQPGGHFWTLDPIDGTKGFLRGDQYVVALALVTAGEVQLGVLGCPNLSAGRRPELGGPGSLVIAVRNQGAWTTPLEDMGTFERLQVSARRNVAEMRILRSYEAEHTNVGQVDQLVELLGVRTEPVRMDSQAKYALLASGEGDLIVRLLSPDKSDYREKIWDQAAGTLVVQEAGGRITDLDGKPLDFTTGRTLSRNRGVLASNGSFHEPALRALREVGA